MRYLNVCRSGSTVATHTVSLTTSDEAANIIAVIGALNDHLKSSGGLEINGKKVEHIDTPILITKDTDGKELERKMRTFIIYTDKLTHQPACILVD